MATVYGPHRLRADTRANWQSYTPEDEELIVKFSEGGGAPAEIGFGDGVVTGDQAVVIGSGPAGTSAGHVQFYNNGRFAFSDNVRFYSGNGALYAKHLNVGVADTETNPASPFTATYGSGDIIPIETNASLTIRIPSGTPDAPTQLLYTVKNTHATATITISFDVSGGQYTIIGRHPQREVLPGEYSDFYVRWVNGTVGWQVLGRPYSPYDIKYYGTPEVGQRFVREFVHTYMRVPWINPGDLGTPRCVTAPTSATTFTLQRSTNAGGSWTAIGTCTFATGQKFGSFVISNTTEFAHGDEFAILSPSNLNGLADLYFIMRVAV